MRPLTESPSIAVERALGILEAVAERSRGLSNADISRRLDIPKSSASYILRVLEKNGYLRRDSDSGKYRLGLKVLSLGRQALSGFNIRQIAHPILRRLVEKTELTAHFAVLDGSEVVYIEKVEAPGFIKMDTWIGRRMEIHTTGVGKALAAFLPEDQVTIILRERGLKKYTARSIGTAQKLFAEFERIRTRGYAIDDEENSIGVRCVAAPVLGEPGAVSGSLGVTGTTAEVNDRTIPGIAAVVRENAHQLSRQLRDFQISRLS